jgi:hypothetical protein
MAGARLGYCAEWLARGMRIALNGWCKADYRAKAGFGAMAANGLSARKQQSNSNRGSRRPTEKIAARQSTGHTGKKKKLQRSNRRIERWQKEKSQRGNWGIALAKRKNAAR